MFGKSRAIVVVDQRTYRNACRRVDELEADDKLVAAKFGIAAICQWLRGEINTGRTSRRAERAADLEQWQLRAAQINRLIGL